jgi:hypothetical protein
MGKSDPTMERLEDQICWYDRRSGTHQRMYKMVKLAQMTLAAAIPVLAGIAPRTPTLLGALGATVVVLEGVQQLYRLHDNWTSYRSTAEALKHEKYLYLASAGPYAAASDAHALLAERTESLISREHAKWIEAAQSEARPQEGE